MCNPFFFSLSKPSTVIVIHFTIRAWVWPPDRPDLVYKRTGDLSIASLLAVWSVNQHTHKLIRHERFGEFFYFLYYIICYSIHSLDLKFSCFSHPWIAFFLHLITKSWCCWVKLFKTNFLNFYNLVQFQINPYHNFLS